VYGVARPVSIPAGAIPSNGVYQGACSIVFQEITNPATLNALACPKALALAEDLGVNKIYVASDCKVVIDDIASVTNGGYGAIIMQIKERSDAFQEKI
jgi:ribonuclease HI